MDVWNFQKSFPKSLNREPNFEKQKHKGSDVREGHVNCVWTRFTWPLNNKHKNIQIEDRVHGCMKFSKITAVWNCDLRKTETQTLRCPWGSRKLCLDSSKHIPLPEGTDLHNTVYICIACHLQVLSFCLSQPNLGNLPSNHPSAFKETIISSLPALFLSTTPFSCQPGFLLTKQPGSSVQVTVWPVHSLVFLKRSSEEIIVCRLRTIWNMWMNDLGQQWCLEIVK